MNPGEDPIEVYQYSSENYFGELSLLRNQTRAATIKATTDMNLLTLDRQSFKRLLGPFEDILKRNESRYSRYI